MPPKPKKKTPKSPAHRLPEKKPQDRIIDAALELASTQGWDVTTVRDIAREAGLDLTEFYEYFAHRDEIIAAYGRRLDSKILAAFPEADPAAAVRDMLFDILMERFDLANGDRGALKSILQSYRVDPKQLLLHLPQLGFSMTRMLEAAGINPYGFRGALRVAGLTAAVAYVTRVWLDDESPDLSQTMAALDKALSRVENLADRFSL